MVSPSVDTIFPHLATNIARFDGMAECYDTHRPQPPPALLDVVRELMQGARPGLVVDLGCGTGLSSRIWADRAEQVIGIEPNDCMLRWAQARSAALQGNVSYRQAFAHETDLRAGCADIVTCSQSLQWMEPQATLAEVFRILRPGGVFAVVHDFQLPMMPWEAVAAYDSFLKRMVNLLLTDRQQHPHKYEAVVSWPRAQQLTYIRECGHFRFVNECLLHSFEAGNANRLVGLARSQSNTFLLLKQGFSEEEIGLAGLRVAADRIFGDQAGAWCFSFQTILAVK
jgi:ubiquinone/menaquinone biosynthesis C-methylase UbiE